MSLLEVLCVFVGSFIGLSLAELLKEWINKKWF